MKKILVLASIILFASKVYSQPVINNVTITDSIECFGETGAITIEITQTIPPTIGLDVLVGSFPYNWNTAYFVSQGSFAVVGGNTIITIPGLFAGDYIIRLVDINNYYTANPFGNGDNLTGMFDEYSMIITLDQPDPLLATTIASLDNLCFGDCIAAEELTITGGTGPYSFSVNASSTQTLAIGDSLYSFTNLCAGNYNIIITDNNSCISNQTFAVNEPSIISSFTTLSSCVPVIWNGSTYTSSGTYSFLTTNSNGCDSTANLNLTITGNSTSSDTTLSSCVPLIWNGNSYATTGTYTDTLIAMDGCDSIVTLNLTIIDNITTEIIGGTSSTLQRICQGATSDPLAVNVLSGGISPYSYQWYSYQFQQQALQAQSIQGETSPAYLPPTINYGISYYFCEVTSSEQGCVDTTQITTIEIIASPEIITQPQDSSVCIDAYITIHVEDSINIITGSNGVYSSYQWYQNNTCDSIGATACTGPGFNTNTYTASTASPGTTYYYCIITHNNIVGCDILISECAEIIIHPDPSISLQPDSINTICVEGVIDSLNITYTNGVGIPTYEWYKNGVAIGINHYSYLPPSSDFQSAGTIYYYAEVYLSGNSCNTARSDSASVLVVDDPLITSINTINQTICQNDIPTDLIVTVQTGSGTTEPYQYLWYNETTGLPAPAINNTDTYTPSTINIGTEYYYCVVTQQASGCEDTSNITEVSINNATSSDTTFSSCMPITWNGNTYNNSGNYSFLTTNNNGCDSTAFLNLTINNPTTGTSLVTSCDTYTWNSQTITSSGSYDQTFTNASGCDSVHTLVATIGNDTSITTIDTACGEYLWNGIIYDSSGVYYDSLITSNGCDSIFILNLTVFEDSSVTPITACDSAQWNGVWYYNDTIVTTTGLTTTNSFGGASSSIISSGKEGNIWYFGQNAGLDFNSGSPVALTDGQLNTNEGCASISDNNGEILFYTEGSSVYNKNHAVMLNGTGLLGNSSSSQSAIIVRKPASLTIYYIFTVDGWSGNNGGLSYSEVDMSLDGGLGGINSNKNILLIPATCEKVTAIKHQNGTDFWVISRVENSNTYHSYLLTSTGVDQIPIITNIGNIYNATGGYMKGSPDGSRIAVSNWWVDNTVDLYDFDNSTGILSNLVALQGSSPSSMGVYGVEFSPSSDILYVTGTGSNINGIGQYDLLAGTSVDINNSFVDLSLTAPYCRALQLGPDKKIYVAEIISSVGVINNPDIIGVGCNYVNSAVGLAGASSMLGLPTFFSSIFNTVAAGCDSVATAIITINHSTSNTTTLTSCDSYEWPVNGTTYNTSGVYTSTRINTEGCIHIDSLILTINNSTSTSINSTVCDTYTWAIDGLTYTTSGIYTSTSINTAGCTHTDSLNLTINRSTTSITTLSSCLPVDWNGTTYNSSGNYTSLTINSEGCDSTANLELTIEGPMILDVEATACNTYYWNAIYYENSGTYTHTTIDNMGCENTTILSLTIFNDNLYVPNTFTPNSDIKNDRFTINHNLKEFNMWIYNRFGEEIFYTDNAKLGWDGTYKNKICQDGIYVWKILFKCTNKLQKETGYIQLLR